MNKQEFVQSIKKDLSIYNKVFTLSLARFIISFGGILIWILIPMNNVSAACPTNDYIETGLGCIDPSAAGITTFVMQLLVGIGLGIGVAKGGLAWWKWRNTESADKKQEAVREIIAIFAGLVIIFLALPILRLVGIDIFHIEGLGGEEFYRLFGP